MRYADVTQCILNRYGESAVLRRNGVSIGTGKALLRPLLDQETQFLPTSLGVRREEPVLGLVQGSLNLSPAPGVTILSQNGTDYEVKSLREVKVGSQRVYWRAILRRREAVET